jgi:capsular polysaccharide biosynthesis protein
VAHDQHHPATVARRYDDALVAHGSVYAGGAVHTIHRRDHTLAWQGRPVDLGPRMLSSNFTVEQYFGHWLLDGVCLELLAAERGLVALGLHRAPWAQEAGYRAQLDLALERHPLARVSRLWEVYDRPMNAGHVARIHELRRRVRRGVAPSGAAPVFLRRVGGVTRRLLNQDALADALARRGFTVLTPEIEPVDTLRATLHDAPIVVSVEGSALCHAVASMADRGTVVAIQPPRRVDWIQKVWTDAAGLRLAQTVATDAGENGFTMEEDRLLRLFDLVERERAAAA